MSSYATLLCIVEVKYLCKNVFGNVFFFFSLFSVEEDCKQPNTPRFTPLYGCFKDAKNVKCQSFFYTGCTRAPNFFI